MIECPAELRSGMDLVVSLSVRIKASAFQKPKVSNSEPRKTMFDQGKETTEEQTLRERKKALGRLFQAVGLKPTRGNDASELGLRNGIDKSDELVQVPKTKSTGDEEEEEGEGEELSEDELNSIYKRYCRSSSHFGLHNWLMPFQSTTE